ncbi:hypothetical protein [Bradyrhizobium japonicum]|jgi:hypothetical protein|uniref:hypothetical protein n=1 Tax=Bradyrhizobium japonicum TaxID=375 RepID=UPI00209EA141|nr:hypothetical protein [Bradyrhizobium japonicum]MCP1766330.1 hypothetical protein [Bradyrhizobium japonicum]MCP1788468.1 hypothetical protein [Bradyrhizobium japonicum]MCP1810343.1 hypothetical protein [Bradyrhizobium japonicum]MCP1819277.1 hypothetical protein [Bradyrhizobium japonicum]MCP1869213.1 hypothetical protein [Bradyrhizobium japonicum]
MKNEPLEVVDSSGLLDADWAEINRWRQVLLNTGLDGLAVTIDALSDRDAPQSGRILMALFPNMVREIVRDELASRGISQQDLLDAIRELESPARDQ